MAQKRIARAAAASAAGHDARGIRLIQFADAFAIVQHTDASGHLDASIDAASAEQPLLRGLLAVTGCDTFIGVSVW